ncbi:MAG: DMT family transporter [Chloroflexota bacterium]
MILSPEIATVFFGLAASVSWGAGDFSGGMATKRANVISVITVVHAIGFVFMLVLALATHETIPPLADWIWGAIAGLAGVFGLIAFYQALSSGRMGVVAPITGVTAALLPVIVGLVSEGLPGVGHLVGFALALISVFLVSYAVGTTWSSSGAGLAISGGIGFGLFLVFAGQVGNTAVFWPLVAARAASTTTMIVVSLHRKLPLPIHDPKLRLPVIMAGGLDALGNVFYVMASQAGRLDVAAVLSSLYPAMTILLAALILKEHIGRIQLIGIVLALVAISLIAI